MTTIFRLGKIGLMLFGALSLLMVIAYACSHRASANSIYSLSNAPQDYTAVYYERNIYTSDVLIYLMSDLDTDTTYTWNLELLNLYTGVTLETLDSVTVGPGATSATVVFAEYFDSWEPDTAGPVRLIDNFGEVKGKHFLAPPPDDSWGTSAGTNDEALKVGMGDVLCECGPAYNSINATTGYHHGVFRLDEITTLFGEVTLMHYRSDSSTVTSTGIDLIELKNTASSAVVATFDLYELADYNMNDSYPVQLAGYNSYVVLTTDGNIPSYIDEVEDLAVFTTQDDPHRLSVDKGVYSYARVDNTLSVTALGESVWFVGNTRDYDWEIKTQSERVRAGQPIRIQKIQHTEEIHDGYSGTQELFDTKLGTLQNTVQPFASTSYFIYDVGTSGDVIITWFMTAADLQFTGADPDDFIIGAVDTYTIFGSSDTLRLDDGIKATMADYGFDTEVGSIIVFLIGLLIIYGLLFTMQAPSGMYSIGFILLSAAMVLTGFFTNLVTVFLAAIDVGLIYVTFVRGNQREGI